MDRRAYWVWLQMAVGSNSAKPYRILEQYPDIAAFYQAGSKLWETVPFLTRNERDHLSEWNLRDAQKCILHSEQLGQNVICLEDREYPAPLRHIHNPPCVLYCKGKLPDFEGCLAVAMVGTRAATESGRKIAFRFACQLAGNGAVIVSGGAKGIDSASHLGALRGNGTTVCVLGCGIGYPYLKEKASMREEIAETGALISEYPYFMEPSRRSFPDRNRIISGLSRGVLVIEAGRQSGALITANLAAEQGKDVFAVPGAIDSPVSAGVNELIKSGARLVTDPGEILEEYGYHYQEIAPVSRQPVQKTEKIQQSGLSSAAKTLYNALQETPKHISELEAETGLTASQLFAAVTELELSAGIAAHAGRFYSLPQ